MGSPRPLFMHESLLPAGGINLSYSVLNPVCTLSMGNLAPFHRSSQEKINKLDLIRLEQTMRLGGEATFRFKALVWNPGISCEDRRVFALSCVGFL